MVPGSDKHSGHDVSGPFYFTVYGYMVLVLLDLWGKRTERGQHGTKRETGKEWENAGTF